MKINETTLKNINAIEIKAFNYKAYLENIPVYRVEIDKDIDIYISQLDFITGKSLKNKNQIQVLLRNTNDNVMKYRSVNFSLKLFNTFNKIEDITKIVTI